MMKKIISILLVLVLCVSLAVTGCSNSAARTPTASTDKYRNYYQIFMNSFCDSNGDETGDFQGVISKLDYLNDGDPESGDDLGIDGIWLSPMMPSPSYHKYDVTDYFDIDPDFGTLEDFDELIKECDARGINVIIDLVVNHSSNHHPYFEKAGEEFAAGKTDGYAQYYNFSEKMTEACNRSFTSNGKTVYYEGRFTSEMPDWNLDYQGTRDYLMEIAKFWIDRGVAGFRLDAVKYFYFGESDKNVEFLKWFYESCKEYKDDIYMVGEEWDDAGYIYDCYKSGIDSMFNFKFAQSAGVYISAARSGQMQSYVKDLKKYNDNILKRNENAINANFLTNHDMVRAGNMLEEDEYKFAAMLYLLSPGNSFTYYGEEIGIEAPNTTNDASYRTAMIWDNDNLPDIYVNGVPEVEQNPLGGVKQQLEQENSLLNTYRQLYKIKLQYPEIARGKITDTVTFDDPKCAGYIEEYTKDDKTTKMLIIYNGNDEAKEIDIKDSGSKFEIWAQMAVTETGKEQTEQSKLDGTSLSILPKSFVVLNIQQ